MLIPHAHHVLWFSATFLLLWSLSLIARGLPANRLSLFFRTKSAVAGHAHASWRAIGLGALVSVLSIRLFMTGEAVKRWSLGDDRFEESTFGAYHAAAAGAFAFAVTLACMGLFRDSARGRKRCPKCWYDMAALAAGGRYVCPECGTDAKNLNGLERTRRHRGPIVAAVMLILVAALTPGLRQVSTGGAKAVVPTTVMIAGMWNWPDEWIWNNTGEDESSLLSRLEKDHAWNWQRRWAADRAQAKLSRVRTLEEYNRAIQIMQASTDGEDRWPADTVANVACRLASTGATARAEALAICQELMEFGWFQTAFSPESKSEIAAVSEEIAAALKQPEPEVVLMAATVLTRAQVQREAVVAAMLKDYATCTGRPLTWRTQTLIAIPAVDKEVVDAILARMASADANVRQMVVEGIFFFQGDATSLEPIVKRLEAMGEGDTDSGIAESAARRFVLIRSRQPDSYDFLLEKARSNGNFRLAALERLAYDNLDDPLDPAVRQLLDAALRDADADAVCTGLHAIDFRATMHDKEMKEYLNIAIRLTTHPDPNVQKAAESAKTSIEQLDQDQNGS